MKRIIAALLLSLFCAAAVVTAPAAEPPFGSTVGNRAADFSVKDIQGKPFTLSKDGAGKVVYLVFWSLG
jgi:cytochrome oxidase Cu insertion factor (SCO1/SenC/PrrC family)